jgi:hypothetical protein
MYAFVNSVCLPRTTGGQWVEENLSNILVFDIYNTYTQVYLVLSNIHLTENINVDFNVLKPEYSSFSGTLNDLLILIGNNTLPSVPTLPNSSIRYAKYGDAFGSNYSVDITKIGVPQGNSLTNLEKTDLVLNKTVPKTDMELLHTHCLISVNGYFHMTDTDTTYAYVKDGAKSLFKSNKNALGILSFLDIGKLTKVPITEDHIYKQAGNSNLTSNPVNNRASILIPFYVYPFDSTINDWVPEVYQLLDVLTINTDLEFNIIINPNNGPGVSADINYTNFIAKLKTTGAKLLGYVPTGYGADITQTKIDSINTNTSYWKILYPGMNGIFFDEVGTDVAMLDFYTSVTSYARNDGFIKLIGNPGTLIDNVFFNIFDFIVTYENTNYPLDTYYTSTTNYNKQVCLVYGKALDSNEVGTLLVKNAMLYVTDSTTPWSTLPTYFSDLITVIKNYNSFAGIINTTPSYTSTSNLKARTYFKLDANITNKTVLLVIGGYLIFPEPNIFWQTGDNSFALNVGMLPMVERYFESNIYLDLSELGLSSEASQPDIINVDELLSDEVLTKWFTMSQSFFVIVDTPNLFTNKIFLKTANMPGMFTSYQEPTYPLMVNYGKVAEYWKVEEDDFWSVNVQDSYFRNFVISTAPLSTLVAATPKLIPSNTYNNSKGYLLEIGSYR